LKKILFLLLIILLGSTIYTVFEKKSSVVSFDTTIDAKSIYVIDIETDEVLYNKNGNAPVAIASMTKLMTQYIVLNAIANDNMQWETIYSPSEAVLAVASKPGFANLKMKSSGQYSVKDLFTAATVISANDATVALAEIVAGDEDNFVRIMNEQAGYFGLKNTLFFNATGLDGPYVGKSSSETNMSSAHDVAVIAKKLLEKHPTVLDFTSIPNIATEAGVRHNTNLMLPGMAYEVSGVDGLKTGFTDEAQLCFTSTGVFNDRRLLTVVIGVPSGNEGGDAGDARFELTGELIDKFGRGFVE